MALVQECECCGISVTNNRFCSDCAMEMACHRTESTESIKERVQEKRVQKTIAASKELLQTLEERKVADKAIEDYRASLKKYRK